MTMEESSKNTSNTFVIRRRQCGEQQLGYIRRFTGLMQAKQLISVIDVLDLDANPRSSKSGSVTNAIIDSIQKDETSTEGPLFPFKTKGILIAASGYILLDRSRFSLSFHDRSTEGILAGGHNTLALGIYILQEAAKACGGAPMKRAEYANWDAFKTTWRARRDMIASYQEKIRTSPQELEEEGISLLKFDIPVELLLPADCDDELCVEGFRRSLLEICDARNNNVQLTQGTKGNQEGLFESFKKVLEQKYPTFAQEVSWKTNDGKRVPCRNIVALSWVPLALTSWVAKGENHVLDAPADPGIYSGKEKCLEKYLDLMRSDGITIQSGSTQRELKNQEVLSALEVACDLPKLFDRLYQKFPTLYSGSYGKIGAVKNLMGSKTSFETPFFCEPTEKPVPDGFIYPLVVGLRALMERDEATGNIRWLTNPFEFIESAPFENAVRTYSEVIQQSAYDPQKVGKGKASYTTAYQSIKLAYLLNIN